MLQQIKETAEWIKQHTAMRPLTWMSAPMRISSAAC